MHAVSMFSVCCGCLVCLHFLSSTDMQMQILKKDKYINFVSKVLAPSSFFLLGFLLIFRMQGVVVKDPGW